MAAVPICSDFGPQENKVCYTVSTVTPSTGHEVTGPAAMILVFRMLSFKLACSLSSFTWPYLYKISAPNMNTTYKNFNNLRKATEKK